MPQTKVDAFFSEFPWLIKYASPSSAKCLYVKRFEISLLPKYPDEWWERAFLGYYSEEPDFDDEILLAEIYILDIKGDILVQVGKWEDVTPARIVPARPASWFWKARPAVIIPEKREWQYDLETIQSALKRLSEMDEKKDKGYFVLSIVNSDKYGSLVNIYKSPKGYDLISWINSEVERERAVLRVECASIDSVAEKIVKTSR